jgi:hypothetical protein
MPKTPSIEIPPTLIPVSSYAAAGNAILGVRAGLSSRSGTFTTYLGALRSDDLITSNGDAFELTSHGSVVLGRYDPLPEGEDLYRHWLSELGSSGAARMLTVLHDAYPRSLSRDELGLLASISSVSGTFTTYLGKLRSLELVTGSKELKASEEFFS